MLRVGGIMGKRTGYRLTRLSESIQRHEEEIAAERRAVVAATARIAERKMRVKRLRELQERLAHGATIIAGPVAVQTVWGHPRGHDQSGPPMAGSGGVRPGAALHECGAGGMHLWPGECMVHQTGKVTARGT